MFKKSTLPLIFFAILSQVSAHAFSSSGFETPESMQVDPEDGSYYVSNINGDPFQMDGNGFISKISANGNIVIQKFIGAKSEDATLHAPKGLVVAGKEIYVTDVNKIKVFNKQTGKTVATVDMTPFNVKFLNDITRDSRGLLYVSDMLANKIYKIDPKRKYEVSVFKEGDVLGQPNGLVINPRNQNLMVVTWKTGEILEIDSSGKIHKLKRGLKALDGIDYDVEGTMYVSSFEKGEIYKIPNYGRGILSIYLAGLETPADISCDRKRHELLIPLYRGNFVMTYPLFKKDANSENAAGA